MSKLDTGQNVAEATATLLIQQGQLKAGRRHVQMFPANTPELELPFGFCRHENARGVFHFWPYMISPNQIDELSLRGRENEMLNLGPFSKVEIAQRAENGEQLVFITEYAPGSVEVRSAVGTHETSSQQRQYFEQTKEPGNVVVVGMPPDRVLPLLMEG